MVHAIVGIQKPVQGFQQVFGMEVDVFGETYKDLLFWVEP
jgi:hypothetical protein